MVLNEEYIPGIIIMTRTLLLKLVFINLTTYDYNIYVSGIMGAICYSFSIYATHKLFLLVIFIIFL